MIPLFNTVSSQEIANPLAFYADVMINATAPEHRIFASDQFETLLEERINPLTSFDDEMKDIPWIFVKYNEARSLRIISWQVQKEEGQFDYGMYLQRKGEEPQRIGQSGVTLDKRAKYSSNDMYTAIIHNITAQDDYFLISSYRQIEGNKIQKSVDVLSFDGENPVFGLPIFYENEKVPDGRGHRRIEMTYSNVASASVNLNLDGEQKTVVYDHIIEVPGKATGEGMIQVPDGSYEAYIYQSPYRWLYKSNLYEGLQYNPKTSSGPARRN